MGASAPEAPPGSRNVPGVRIVLVDIIQPSPTSNPCSIRQATCGARRPDVLLPTPPGRSGATGNVTKSSWGSTSGSRSRRSRASSSRTAIFDYRLPDDVADRDDPRLARKRQVAAHASRTIATVWTTLWTFADADPAAPSSRLSWRAGDVRWPSGLTDDVRGDRRRPHRRRAAQARLAEIARADAGLPRRAPVRSFRSTRKSSSVRGRRGPGDLPRGALATCWTRSSPVRHRGRHRRPRDRSWRRLRRVSSDESISTRIVVPGRPAYGSKRTSMAACTSACCSSKVGTRSGSMDDLCTPDRHEVFVVGDLIAKTQNGKPLPGVAQLAIQSGRHAARNIRLHHRGCGPGLPPSLCLTRD